MGREGQGPGEFRSLRQITIAGDFLVVYDSTMRRMSVWTLDGEYVDDHLLASRNFLMAAQGLADESFVSNFADVSESPSVNVARHSRDRGSNGVRCPAQPGGADDCA